MVFFLPPLAAAAAAPQTLQPEPNPTALPGAFLAECMPGATPPPLSNASQPFAPSGVLVHLHYFEPPEMEACERANKRTNLAFFLAHAVEPSTPADGLFFHITANVLPPIGEFYASIGLPTPSRATLVPERANVRAELTAPSPASSLPPSASAAPTARACTTTSPGVAAPTRCRSSRHRRHKHTGTTSATSASTPSSSLAASSGGGG